jgi:hypothetical protein
VEIYYKVNGGKLFNVIYEVHGKLHKLHVVETNQVFEATFEYSGIWKLAFDSSWKKCPKCGKKTKTCFCRTCAKSDTEIRQIVSFNTKYKFATSTGYFVAMQNPATREILKKNNIERYGFGVPSQNKDVWESIKRKRKELTGYETPFSDPAVQKKAAASMVERYGGHTLASPELLKKHKETLLKNYGVTHNMYSDVVKDKIRETCIERYGELWSSAVPEIRDRMISTKQRRMYRGKLLHEWKGAWREEYFMNGSCSAIRKYPFISAQVAYKNFFDDDEISKGVSKNEIEIRSIFSSILSDTTKYNQKSCVPGNNFLEIDILDEENKIAIEFSGIYWHQHKHDKYLSDISKMRSMRGAGYKYIVLDETDFDRYSVILSHMKRRVSEKSDDLHLLIDSPKVEEFMNSYNIFGSISNSDMSISLSDNYNILQSVVFKKCPFSTNRWMIKRMCTKSEIEVIGGYEKILREFFLKTECEELIAHANIKFFTGETLKSIGFSYSGEENRRKFWFKGRTIQTVNRKAEAEQICKNYDPNATVYENMQNNGWLESLDYSESIWRMTRDRAHKDETDNQKRTS